MLPNNLCYIEKKLNYIARLEMTLRKRQNFLTFQQPTKMPYSTGWRSFRALPISSFSGWYSELNSKHCATFLGNFGSKCTSNKTEKWSFVGRKLCVLPFCHFSKSFTLARYVKKCSVYTLTHDISSTLLKFGPGGYTPENFDDVRWPERQLETILFFAKTHFFYSLFSSRQSIPRCQIKMVKFNTLFQNNTLRLEYFCEGYLGNFIVRDASSTYLRQQRD